MLRLAANLSTLFPGLPWPERFAAAAAAGFRAVEIQFPYELSPERLRELLDEHGLELVLFNAPPGDAERGERGLAGLPGSEARFRDSLERVAEYSAATGCRRVHVMAGMRNAALAAEAQFACFEANLAAAAARLPDVMLMIEPINTRVDVPGYLLDSTARAVDIIRRLALPNLRLQFDFYHQQIQEGDLARRFDALLPLIGHVQLADNPGRHEPGTGEINYPWLLRHVAASDYRGWVGCEYTPREQGAAGFAWAEAFL